MVILEDNPAFSPRPTPAPAKQSLRMSPAKMYDRMLASDASYNGRFFTGVLTTGIYCLPACRARKPKFQNVKFFPTCEAARANGLRACRKCHPDDFARGADPVLETLESLVAEVRANPSHFPDVRTLTRRSGFGATRIGELFRLHYHATPAEILLRARLEFARRALIENNQPLAEVAADAGFDSLSTFHENFRHHLGTTPAAYRRLAAKNSCAIALPKGYPLEYLRRALSRDPQSLNEQLTGNVFKTAVHAPAGPAILHVELSPERIVATISPGNGVEAHRFASLLLGLDQDAPAFARFTKKLGLSPLTSGREQLRITQTLSVFDGLVWSILGQQINLAFACALRARLTKLAGTPTRDGLYAPPTAAQVSKLEVSDLLPLQFSRSKAHYLISAARLVAAGKFALESLRTMSATRAERTLLAIHGLGPWSVNYVMLRALGFSDCVPLGDTGVTSGLQSLLRLNIRPDLGATRRLMAVFSPYRSLATAHLWQLNKPVPT